MLRRVFTSCLVAVSVALASSAAAQDEPRFSLVAEGATVWQNRNDVRIPTDTGTEFSIVDVIGTGPWAAGRVELTAGLTDRQQLRLVYAPLNVSGDGTLDGPVSFAGETFAPGAVSADYRFSNYRLTYRYQFRDGERWQWWIGFTGFVRDARIALAQDGVAAEDTDVGFVPLVHLSGTARLSPRWRFVLDVDAAAASQGRAIDLATLVRFDPSPRWHVAFGYRTIEGGADVDAVYTFAWINAAVARVGVGF